MSTSLTIRKVESAPDLQAFFEFPWRLYQDEPNWVPPLVSMRRSLLDKQKNPDWKYLEGDYFAAWRGDRLVGTIAAFINHRHNEANQEHIGWFGAFDVYDDPEAGAALLNVATDWVRSRGYDAIAGPQTFSTHGDCGILVDGFTRPVLLMPYNYPYYAHMVESAGFNKKEDLYSFHLSKAQALQMGLNEQIQQVVRTLTEQNGITVRPIDRRHLRSEFELFKEIYHGAFNDTGGFFPITERELDHMVTRLGRYFDPDYAFFAHIGDEPVGFVMGVPDFNQVLQKAKPRPGVPEALTLLRAFWYWKVRPTMDWLRVALLGVKTTHRKKGVAVALYGALVEACLKGTKVAHVDCGWISEKNDPMLGIVQRVGLERYKTHRLYEKRFD